MYNPSIIMLQSECLLDTHTHTHSYSHSIPPTSLLPGVGYHEIGKAFLGEGFTASTPEQLRHALGRAFSKERMRKRGRPLVINVIIDPTSGRKPQVRHLINYS